MSGLRNYVDWHEHYNDPNSGLSWRLRTVQGWLRGAIEARPGPLRVLSACAGDGRDILGVLAERDDVERVTTTLIELHPDIARRACARAAADETPNVEVRVADAGLTDSYIGAVPADVVLLVGILGNISDVDLERTIRAAPAFCGAGATLIWSRGRDETDRNDEIRGWFAEAGFSELAYAALERGSRPALGAVRFEGKPQSLTPGVTLFRFLR